MRQSQFSVVAGPRNAQDCWVFAMSGELLRAILEVANQGGCEPPQPISGRPPQLPPSTFLEKSYPRNQRYLHPRSLGAGVAVCEVNEARKFTVKLDFELALVASIAQRSVTFTARDERTSPARRISFSRMASPLSSLVTTRELILSSSCYMPSRDA